MLFTFLDEEEEDGSVIDEAEADEEAEPAAPKEQVCVIMICLTIQVWLYSCVPDNGVSRFEALA